MNIKKIPKEFVIKREDCYRYTNKLSPELKYGSTFKKIIKKQNAEDYYFKIYDVDAPLLNQLCLLNDLIYYAFLRNFPEQYIFDEKLYYYTLKIYKMMEMMKYNIYYFEKNNGVVIFNNSKKSYDVVEKFTFLKNLLYNKYFNTNEIILVQMIFDKISGMNIKNRFLRDYLRINYEKELYTQKNYEKALVKKFNELKKTNKGFIQWFDNYYQEQLNISNQLEIKLFKSTEYKKYKKTFAKDIQKFKYPWNKVFSDKRPYSYKMYKTMTDEFAKTIL